MDLGSQNDDLSADQYDHDSTSAQWNDFMNSNDDFLPNIIRIDSAEIIYTPDTHASFIGDKYLKGDLLGEGSYSKVKEVLDIDTLCRRAVKIVKCRKIRKIPNGLANVKREINILKRLEHKNVIRLIEEFVNDEKQKKYIVLEYCCCNLQAMLDECDQKKFPEWQAHYYFMQLIDGLEYLHSRGIIHKDIKPANLLLTIDQVLKITDLGVSEELDQFAKDDTITTSQGSPVSQSPEIAAGDDSFSGYKVDIWSCGVTLYRMCTTQYPFDGETICKLYDNIAKAEYTVPDHLSDKAKVLIKGMLAKSANDRLTIADIRRTEWFRQQKPMEDDNVLMPTTADNRAFAMTMFPNLKALIMTANGQSPAYESDNEVVLGATECYNVSDGEPVPTDSYDVNVNNSVRPGNEASHSAAQPTSRKKQKKCSIS